MAQDDEVPERRLSGEAAWKAARDATERRNSEAKRRASETTTASAHAAIERAQLKVLNARIASRNAGFDDGVAGKG